MRALRRRGLALHEFAQRDAAALFIFIDNLATRCDVFGVGSVARTYFFRLDAARLKLHGASEAQPPSSATTTSEFKKQRSKRQQQRIPLCQG